MRRKRRQENNLLKKVLSNDISKEVIAEGIGGAVSFLLRNEWFFWLITAVVLGAMLLSKCIIYVKKKDSRKKKFCKSIAFYIFALSIWLTLAISGVYMRAAEFVENMARIEREEEGNEKDKKTQKDDKKKKVDTSQSPRIIPSNVNLVINILDIENIEAEIYDDVFFIGENISSDSECQLAVKNKVYNLSQKKRDNKLRNCNNEEVNEIVSEASLDEELLLKKQDDCKTYRLKNEIDAWYADIPKASEVLDIINSRIELYPNYFNAELAYLVSNNFLSLALEYINQEKSGKSILYYECMSIIYAQKNLEYKEVKNNKFNRMVKFIATRYREISDCDLLEEDVRVRAKRIYRAYCSVFRI